MDKEIYKETEYVKNMKVGDTVNTLSWAYHPVNKMYAIEMPSACGWEWFYADEIEAMAFVVGG